MAALLVGDSQLAASGLPLDAMRKNAAPAGPKLREDMSHFMAQSAIDFVRMLTQSWI